MSHSVCVNCGCSTPKLYRRYNLDVLKLSQCEKCEAPADKYIEYDTVIIAIDQILFKQESYRHILYNTEFKNYWKMLVVIFLLKTYVQWATSSSVRDSSLFSKHEYDFYRAALVTAIGTAFFSSAVALCIKIDGAFKKRPVTNSQLLLVWKALILSEFGIFLLLPSVIWTMEVERRVHHAAVLVYVLISRVQALSVVTSCSRISLLLLVILCLVGESYIKRSLSEFLSW